MPGFGDWDFHVAPVHIRRFLLRMRVGQAVGDFVEAGAFVGGEADVAPVFADRGQLRAAAGHLFDLAGSEVAPPHAADPADRAVEGDVLPVARDRRVVSVFGLPGPARGNRGRGALRDQRDRPEHIGAGRDGRQERGRKGTGQRRHGQTPWRDGGTGGAPSGENGKRDRQHSPAPPARQ